MQRSSLHLWIKCEIHHARVCVAGIEIAPGRLPRRAKFLPGRKNSDRRQVRAYSVLLSQREWVKRAEARFSPTPALCILGGLPRLISFRGKTSVGISNLFAMDSVLNQVYRLAVKSQTKDLTDFWKPVRSHYFSSAIFPINFASIAARGIMDLSSAYRLRSNTSNLLSG
jgi:hypothetical protein